MQNQLNQEHIDDGRLYYWHRLVHFAVDYLLSLLRLQIPYSILFVARALGAEQSLWPYALRQRSRIDRLEKVLSWSWNITTHEMASCSNLRPFLSKAL